MPTRCAAHFFASSGSQQESIAAGSIAKRLHSVRGRLEKQIPFGNDNKKSKGKNIESLLLLSLLLSFPQRICFWPAPSSCDKRNAPTCLANLVTNRVREWRVRDQVAKVRALVT